METKREFLELALKEGANRRELCRRFGVSPKTAYALLKRCAKEGVAQACVSHSTRPVSSPFKTSLEMEEQVIELRQLYGWGARKIARRMLDLGAAKVPAASTITDILRRHGLISEQASTAAQHWQRFEHEEPNALWQIDFKGRLDTPAGPCHPLTLLDDHSRFNLTIKACATTETASVQAHLREIFECYGLPVRLNADNGPPWGSPSSTEALSELAVWLIRLGIRVSHSRPYHPQTNGKLERFHRSLDAEVLRGRNFMNLPSAQRAFSYWREVYNHERPHEALGMTTPVQRYRISPRAMPPVLPEIEYGPDDQVLHVGWNGRVDFKGRRLRVSNALHRLPIAMRPSDDGCFEAYFCHHRLMRLDLRQPSL